MNSQLRRLRQLEPKPHPAFVPHHVIVERDETEEQALARFRAKYPKLPKGHWLCVKPKPLTIEEWRELSEAHKADEARKALAAETIDKG